MPVYVLDRLFSSAPRGSPIWLSETYKYATFVVYTLKGTNTSREFAFLYRNRAGAVRYQQLKADWMLLLISKVKLAYSSKKGIVILATEKTRPSQHYNTSFIFWRLLFWTSSNAQLPQKIITTCILRKDLTPLLWAQPPTLTWVHRTYCSTK